jgi:hypothetical protein
MAVTDDLPWNTTRCNRLLRPLSSKLAKLRKELERPQSSSGERRTSANAFSLKASPRKAAIFSKLAVRKPHGLEKRNDPDWMPNTGPVGVNRKTYGGRGTKKASATQRAVTGSGSTRPGEIAFTPLIARTGGRYQDSPQMHSSPLKRQSKNRGPLIAKAEQIQELKKQMPTDIGNLVKGLSEAYANLLKATTVGDEKRWKGTRSLFGACLRKIPDYIELEEYFAELDKEENEEEDEDNREISQVIYTHLEAQFETTPGQGWRAFKQVVRAHGTSLLCDAFADQMLGLETLHLLVSHCLNASAWEEAEKLLWSYFQNLKPMLIPNTLLANLFDGQRSLYMWMVMDFVCRTGRHRFLYDLLEYMISQELLPLEWLATECMRSVWDRLVRVLSDGDPRSQESAFRFLETVIFAGIGLPDESLFEEGEIDTVAKQFKPSSKYEFRKALNTTFSSLFTVFTSIALVNRAREETSGDRIVERVTWVLDSILISLLKRKDVQDDLKLLGPVAENMQTFVERAFWIAFASFLIHLEGCQLGASMLSLDVRTTAGAISWISTQYSSKHVDVSAALTTLPEFASSAARGTGRIWKDDGFDQMQRLVHGMLSLSGIRLPHKLWTLKRLALESVMEYAHSTRDAQHMAYARDIEKTMRIKGHVVITQSPMKDDSPSTSGGFRWEEGIGEWVACTPFAKQDAKPVPRKPMRALELLPSPDLPQDNDADADDLPQTTVNGDIVWDTTLPDNDDNDYTFAQSSPVKKGRQISVSSHDRRSRASSPTVLIPGKRMMMTPPDSPVMFYPELPEDSLDDGIRKSRRKRKEVHSSVSTLRSRSSRSSLDKRLRNQKRKTYEEIRDLNAGLEESSEDESSPNTSFSSSLSGNEKPRSLRQARTRSSIGETSTRSAMKSQPVLDTPLSPSPSVDGKAQSSRTTQTRSTRSSLGKRSRKQAVEENETSHVKRRRSGRRVTALREWWKVDGGDANATGEEESEDELSLLS